jgi:hypothetical protein
MVCTLAEGKRIFFRIGNGRSDRGELLLKKAAQSPEWLGQLFADAEENRLASDRNSLRSFKWILLVDMVIEHNTVQMVDFMLKNDRRQAF